MVETTGKLGKIDERAGHSNSGAFVSSGLTKSKPSESVRAFNREREARVAAALRAANKKTGLLPG